MPPLPGEERLVTVFADIHYYFAQPTARPVLHRFEKATYFYIYYNATRQTTRLEVANGPGTPEQDAFNGYLDDCQVVNSHKFPSLVTLIVNTPGASTQTSGARSPTSRDPEEWRLASADPREQGKLKYRLHTLDIYFWTVEDAKQVTDLLKRLLPPSQLDIAEAEQPAQHEQHHEDVTPVVQNLENVALSDPAYRDGRTRNSQNQPQTQPSPLSQAPPQLRGAAAQSQSPVSLMSSMGRSDSAKHPDPAAFTPMAYNPAAPPAPEPIAHREKTPPPPDAADGTGLGAAIHDAPYRPGLPQNNTPYTIPGALGPVPNVYGHVGSPPPPAASSYGSPPPQVRTSVSSATPSFGPSATPSFGPPPSNLTQSTSRQSSTAQHYAPPPKDEHPYAQEPVETPGTQFYNSLGSHEHRHQSLAHVQPQYPDYLAAKTSPQPPLGGYSDYQYHPAGAPVAGPPAGGPGDIHSQVYRPTENEAHGHKSSRPAQKNKYESRFDQSADKIEKKAGGWLKKLEKRIG